MIDSAVLPARSRQGGKLEREKNNSCLSDPEMSVVKNAESARLFVLASRQVLMVPVCVVLACALNRRAAKGDVSQGQDAFSNNDVCVLVYIYAFMEKKKKKKEF